MGQIMQGVDGSGIVHNVLIDTTGKVVTSGVNKPSTPNYDGVFREYLSDAAPPAGSQWKYFTAVPAGRYYVIEGIAFRNVTRAMTHPLIAVYDGVAFYPFWDIATLALNTYGVWQGSLLLAPSEQIAIYFTGVVLLDNLQWRYFGHYILI